MVPSHGVSRRRVQTMKSEDFYRLVEYISSLQYTQEQIMLMKYVVNNLTVAYYEKAENGHHIGSVASLHLDMMIQEGACLTECMRECNVSKTTVLRHRKKLKKQKEEEQKQRELEEQRKQEILSRSDSDIEKQILLTMERIQENILPLFMAISKMMRVRLMHL